MCPGERHAVAGKSRRGKASARTITSATAFVRAYRRHELHVILDNSSSHGTPAVRAWIANHPQVHFHFTPTSAS